MPTTEIERCADCGHIEHQPSLCLHDNCGDTGISRTTSGRELTVTFETPSSITGYGYDTGHRVPRFGQRKGKEY